MNICEACLTLLECGRDALAHDALRREPAPPCGAAFGESVRPTEEFWRCGRCQIGLRHSLAAEANESAWALDLGSLAESE